MKLPVNNIKILSTKEVKNLKNMFEQIKKLNKKKRP